MAKFKMGGSGSNKAGAGYIGNHYFAHANEIYETDDLNMIKLLIDSKMAIEIIEEIPIINEIPVMDDQPIKKVGRPFKNTQG